MTAVEIIHRLVLKLRMDAYPKSSPEADRAMEDLANLDNRPDTVTGQCWSCGHIEELIPASCSCLIASSGYVYRVHMPGCPNG